MYAYNFLLSFANVRHSNLIRIFALHRNEQTTVVLLSPVCSNRRSAFVVRCVCSLTISFPRVVVVPRRRPNDGGVFVGNVGFRVACDAMSIAYACDHSTQQTQQRSLKNAGTTTLYRRENTQDRADPHDDLAFS